MANNTKNFTIVIVITASIFFWLLLNSFSKSQISDKSANLPTDNTPVEATTTPAITFTSQTLNTPTTQFKQRITKKYFGTYITPQNSPISPERFSGYHTGVDVEFTDTKVDVPIFAVADGTVVVSRTASGYGGVLVIRHSISGQTLFGVYGHLRPFTMKRVGDNVSRGEQIALLGQGFTSETDGERKHLHFALAKSNTLAGYAANQAALSGWLDPLSFY